MSNTTTLNARLTTLQDFSQQNPQFKLATLRGFIQRNHRNIRRCLVRYGRRVYLDVDAFEKWVLEGREVHDVQ